MKKYSWYLAVVASTALQSGVQAMKLTSPSFKNNEPLNKMFAHNECGGQNISPELQWADAPKGTKSFVLICDDPDAPKHQPWVHWVVYDIPSNVTKLAQEESFKTIFARQGKNSWGLKQYGGPCPPQGSGTHHYHFTLYALDIDTLYVQKTPDKNEALEAMQGHILGQAEIVGLYKID